MAQLSVLIDGKQFRMACEDGQESHLETLAAHLSARIGMMRQSFGEIGDLRLTVMAALMLCDELFEEKNRVETLSSAMDAQKTTLRHAYSGVSERDREITEVLEAFSLRIERATRLLAGEAQE